MRILVSAGEASGDLYAAQLVNAVRRYYRHASFFGCTGPRLRESGVETILDAKELSVVGLAEVVSHLPRIYWRYRQLVAALQANPPDAAILTDSPDFHLRLARHLKRLGVPVYYLVAPQVWAWRQGRVRVIRDRVRKLFCLFPFEEPWFRERGVDAHYIGHPLAATLAPRLSRDEFLARNQLNPSLPLLALLPGSRAGESRRHLPGLLAAVEILSRDFSLQVAIGTPHGFAERGVFESFRERIRALSIKVVEDQTADLLAYSTLALAASGTVTMEGAVLGTPMVTFYKVTDLTWWLGRRLVKVPYLSMVNLLADRPVVPELMQGEMTPENLAREARRLLSAPEELQAMRAQLNMVKASLLTPVPPFEAAASILAADLGAERRIS